MSSCTFTEALHKKYCDEDDNNIYSGIVVVGSGPGRCGPTGKLTLPRVLTLNGCCIDRAGSFSTIEDLCHNVEELDLAQNELCNLTEVNSIISRMPNLSFLNLSHNNLGDATSIPLNPAHSIRNLVLNHTYLSWSAVNALMDAMPNVQELHLSLNDYNNVLLDPLKQYLSVKRLYVNGNPLETWDDVITFGRTFPSLEALTMADCTIETISRSHSWNRCFRRLHSINISNGLLSEWEDLEALNSIPHLEDFRLQGLPVLEGLGEQVRRQHLIARLPNAARLNGSPVTQKEREEAERAFIRWFLDLDEKPPRFHELQEIHGRLEPLADIDLSPTLTATVKIVCEEQRHTVVINLQQSVRDLKVQLGELCGLTPVQMRVFYFDKEMMEVQGPEELRYNGRKLYSHGIRDGDEIHVIPK